MPRVLVIDDDAACRFSIRAAVPDWEVFEANDGLMGLTLLRQVPQSFDLIVLDINMPRLDGYSTCQQLRELNASIPILPFTAIIDDALPLLMALGCLPVLRKDVYPGELREHLLAAIGQPLAQSVSGRDIVPLGGRVVLFASNPEIRRNLNRGLRATGIRVIEATIAANLHQLVQLGNVKLVIVSAEDHQLVRTIVEPLATPLLVVAQTLAEALEQASTATMPFFGVILAMDAEIPHALADAITIVSNGYRYIPLDETAQLSDASLTQREQMLVSLDLQHMSMKEITSCMYIDMDALLLFRQRIHARLISMAVSSRPPWALEWLGLFPKV
jgi:CheY-like chemotaxis protein